MIPLEQVVKIKCDNCEKNESSNCPSRGYGYFPFDYAETCPEIIQVLIDYNLKAREVETGVLL